jgi:hypothetical protein
MSVDFYQSHSIMVQKMVLFIVSACHLLLTSFLPGSPFDPEDGSSTFSEISDFCQTIQPYILIRQYCLRFILHVLCAGHSRIYQGNQFMVSQAMLKHNLKTRGWSGGLIKVKIIYMLNCVNAKF